MKVFALIAAASAFLTLGQAQADVFSTYETIAYKVTADIQKGTPQNSEINQLVVHGYTIMDLYLVKYPECRAQYNEVKQDDAFMKTASFEVLESKYHDGVGLTEAPKHCYQGRSMVIHPYMAQALLRTGQAGADHEIEEVAKRASNIKKKLGL